MIFLSVFILAAQVKTLANPVFLSGLIKKTRILTKLPEVAEAYVATSRATGQENLNVTVLIKIIAQSLDPNLLEKETINLLQVFADFAHGRSSNLNTTIDLKKFKDNFTQKWANAPELYRTEYDKLRPCKENETPDRLAEQGPIISCKSPELSAATLAESARSANINDFLKLIPDQFSLSELAKSQTSVFDRVRTGFNILNLIFWPSLTLSILGVVALTALGWPNFRAITGWNGWIFFITACPILILDLLSGQINRLIQTNLTGKISSGLMAIITPILNQTNQELMRATIVVSAVVAGIGVILIILSFILPKIEPRVLPPNMAPPIK